ncbi:hypothetical protein CYMTET_34103 [Cymbomonas tetramitiformis]|uniref:Uncharacterized protein n=1 Tax=Cymbomonas tetramitiformis TaxID=36881 RepID=A0AAE0FBW2_9CHLO|nr:hypothetical protein CYMTET_34103 [Cymbomonas tetramitiformis]
MTTHDACDVNFVVRVLRDRVRYSVTAMHEPVADTDLNVSAVVVGQFYGLSYNIEATVYYRAAPSHKSDIDVHDDTIPIDPWEGDVLCDVRRCADARVQLVGATAVANPDANRRHRTDRRRY